jgi:hypothetical protein
MSRALLVLLALACALALWSLAQSGPTRAVGYTEWAPQARHAETP